MTHDGLWIVPFLALGGVAAAQPKPREKPNPAPKRYDLRAGYHAVVGTRIKTVHDTKTEFLINVKRKGKPLRVENKTEGYELKYTDEVQEVQPGGAVTRVERTYTWSKNHKTGQIDRTPRTIVLSWGQKGLAYDEGQAAALAEKARSLLDVERRRPQGVMDSLIPRRRIGVGEAWRIPNAAATQMFLLNPDDMLEEASRCVGKLVSAKPLKDGTDRLRLAFAFDLVLTKMHGFIFDESVRIKLASDVLSVAEGASPVTRSTSLGEIRGEGHHPDHPKGVTVEFTLRIAGKYESAFAR